MGTWRNIHSPSVFLNIPFDRAYEPLFLAIISSLVALGRSPRCVLELPEHGQGRLARIFDLICSCPVSIHDLSRVGVPVRFNMPFELGIAVSLSRLNPPHVFVLLETRPFRLSRTLSDLNGIDPGIHGATVRGMISCILSHLGKPTGNLLPEQVAAIHRELLKTVPFLKKAHGHSTIYSRAIFGELVEAAVSLARKHVLISE